MSQFENDYLALDTAMGQMKLDDLEENNFLEHHGIKDQKHGVRRFQNYDGSLTPAGRERYGVGPARKKKAINDKASVKAEKKAVRESIGHKRLMKKLRDHPDKVHKYRKKLTDADIDELKKQLDFDHKCQDITYEERNRTLKKVQQMGNYSKSLNTILSQSVGIYNNAALVYNMFADASGRRRLPQMAWNKSGGDSDKKKNSDNQPSDDSSKKKNASDNQSGGKSNKKSNSDSGGTTQRGLIVINNSGSSSNGGNTGATPNNTSGNKPVNTNTTNSKAKRTAASPRATRRAEQIISDNASTPMSEVTKYTFANRYRMYGRSY